MGTAGTLAVLAVGQGLYGLAMGMSNSHEMSYRQLVTPDELQARTNTTLHSLNRAVIVVVAPVAGILADAWGVRPTMVLAAVIFALVAAGLGGTSFRDVRAPFEAMPTPANQDHVPLERWLGHHALMTPDVVAACWLFRRDGSVLAVSPSGVDAYYLPGGMPEQGESLIDAVVREVWEEVAIRLDRESVQEVVRVRTEAHGALDRKVTLVGFTADGTGEPQACPPEIEHIRWLPQSDWRLLAPATRIAVERARGPD